MQEEVFDQSYVGKAARDYSSTLLITPLPPPDALLVAEEKERAATSGK